MPSNDVSPAQPDPQPTIAPEGKRPWTRPELIIAPAADAQGGVGIQLEADGGGLAS